jgi:hypothetical protein
MAMIVHHAVSLDGYSADAGGLPAILEAPGFDHGRSSHGVPEFMAGCGAVVMGHCETFNRTANSRPPPP